MKRIINITFILLLGLQTYAQNSNHDAIFSALEDELSRNFQKLELENLDKPCFISYTLFDIKKLTVSASLGSIINSEFENYKTGNIDMVVGTYERNNQNFMEMSYTSSDLDGEFPVENDYDGIRRAFWIESDYEYKTAVEAFEHKKSAINQQNLDEDFLALPDFSKAESQTKIINKERTEIKQYYWESVSKEVSQVLKSYPDLFASEINLFQYQVDVYYVNSEGSKFKRPLDVIAFKVIAFTQAEDGEALTDYLLYYGLDEMDIPTKETLIQDTKKMAEMLVRLKNAPVYDDSYAGPVLFTEAAAGEIFLQNYFAQANGIYSYRKPVYADEDAERFSGKVGKLLEDKLGRKVITNNLSVYSKPGLDKSNGQTLIGSYQIDAEAVLPQELLLVDKGLLKNVLTNRTPSEAFSNSTGNENYSFSSYYGIQENKAPGVLVVEPEKTKSEKKIKKELIKLAKNEGLEYGILVRKIDVSNSGSSNYISGNSDNNGSKTYRPVYIYKVYVDDGREELIRGAEISGVSVSAFKRVEAVSGNQFVYNTLMEKSSGGGGFFFFYSGFGSSISGIPVSVILPDQLLFEELEISKKESGLKLKLPVVENPVK
jgi:predicted Zn-dependent protease